ncbi:hypothetical protein [Acetobacter okinawensis]|nr:hypothetical protein [Acetobacter okinawensis]
MTSWSKRRLGRWQDVAQKNASIPSTLGTASGARRPEPRQDMV